MGGGVGPGDADLASTSVGFSPQSDFLRNRIVFLLRSHLKRLRKLGRYVFRHHPSIILDLGSELRRTRARSGGDDSLDPARVCSVRFPRSVIDRSVTPAEKCEARTLRRASVEWLEFVDPEKSDLVSIAAIVLGSAFYADPTTEEPSGLLDIEVEGASHVASALDVAELEPLLIDVELSHRADELHGVG